MKRIIRWHKDYVNKFMMKTSLDAQQLSWLSFAKGLIVGILLTLSTTSNAQVNYCDSITYDITPQQTLTVVGDAWSLSNMVDSIEWIWQACNSTMCYSANGTMVTFPNILTTDTVKVCYDVYIYMDSSTYVCTNCDSLVFDGNFWVLMSMSNPTGINELHYTLEGSGKMYDMLGRELLEVPEGVMYIRDNKKYIKIK